MYHLFTILLKISVFIENSLHRSHSLSISYSRSIKDEYFLDALGKVLPVFPVFRNIFCLPIMTGQFLIPDLIFKGIGKQKIYFSQKENTSYQHPLVSYRRYSKAVFPDQPIANANHAAGMESLCRFP